MSPFVGSVELNPDSRYAHWFKFYNILKQLLLDLTFCDVKLLDLGASEVFPVDVPSRRVMNGNA